MLNVNLMLIGSSVYDDVHRLKELGKDVLFDSIPWYHALSFPRTSWLGRCQSVKENLKEIRLVVSRRCHTLVRNKKGRNVKARFTWKLAIKTMCVGLATHSANGRMEREQRQRAQLQAW